MGLERPGDVVKQVSTRLGGRRQLIQSSGSRPIIRGPPRQPQGQAHVPHANHPETRQSGAQQIDIRAIHERQQPGEDAQPIAAPRADDFRPDAWIRSAMQDDSLVPRLQHDGDRLSRLELEAHCPRTSRRPMPFEPG